MLPDAVAFVWFAFTFSSFLLFSPSLNRNGCMFSPLERQHLGFGDSVEQEKVN